MYKYTTSQLPATFNSYFKLIADVHSYNPRQIKTRQFVLPKAHSNSGAKIIKYSAIEIWSKIPPEIKNKTCLALFLEKYSIRNMYYSATRTTFYVFIYCCTYSKWIDLKYRYYSGKCQIMKCLCYVLHRYNSDAFTETGLIKPVYEVVGCLQNKCISVLMHVLTSSFLQNMIARLVLNLLKSRDTIAVLQWSIAFDAFPLWHSRIFLNV